MSSPAAEVYTQRANPAFEAALATRSAAQDAAFFAQALRPGMNVLDVGCGPGSITRGLAELVAPGSVVGIDIQAAQIEQARASAAACGLTHLRFERADLYDLPFADRHFDAALANGVLMHLAQPMHALAQLRRVLRPGGLVGIRDPDFGSTLYAPLTPLLQQWLELRLRVRQHNGGSPLSSRHYRRFLIDAGFTGVEATASIESAGSPETVLRHAGFLKAQMVGLARTALAQGWMDQEQVDATAAEIDAWGRRPDSFCATTWCQVIGRVSEGTAGAR
jgi:ubiquinone/menaquinone biosynthesis C-methylase UbiE